MISLIANLHRYPGLAGEVYSEAFSSIDAEDVPSDSDTAVWVLRLAK